MCHVKYSTSDSCQSHESYRVCVVDQEFIYIDTKHRVKIDDSVF